MNNSVQIYMPLLDEGVDVWRPVWAEHIRDNIYKILPKQEGQEEEVWKFNPGEYVVCEYTKSANGSIYAATRITE